MEQNGCNLLNGTIPKNLPGKIKKNYDRLRSG
jgi:hypothetical protein